MKKTIKVAVVSIALVLTIALATMFAACANGPVKFTGQGSGMGLDMNYELTLNTDNSFTFVATTEKEMEENGPLSQILKMLERSGSYKYENDVYTLTFTKAVKNASNEDTTTISSTYKDGKYTIAFSIKGGDITLPITVTYTK